MQASRILAGAIVLAVAAGSAFATIQIAAGSARHGPPVRTSKPRFVTPQCYRDRSTRSACLVALRYLHGLDLDRFEEACGELARETLEQAGGAPGCVRRLSRARGKRIRYRIDEAEISLLGVTVYFRTRAVGRRAPEIQQVMLVVPEGKALRIVAVQPNPHPATA